ncbi:MAG: hypothetical protein Q8Q01_00650 [archaeon]|nr:hypothetical protein [archaeon]
MAVEIITKEEYFNLERDLEFVTIISSQPRVVDPTFGTRSIAEIYDREKNFTALCDLAVKEGGHYLLEMSCADYFRECFNREIKPIPTSNNVNRVFGVVYKKKD